MALQQDLEFVSKYTELSSVALGGYVASVSDEFFAEAHHLLLVEPAPSLKGQFGPNGALYSGWETRRHNPEHDWCLIKLGLPGKVVAVDIDTSHFNGNEAPEASVHGIKWSGNSEPRSSDEWFEVLPKTKLGPNKQHIFRTSIEAGTSECTHVLLRIYPDGGVARFRAYGLVTPVMPKDPSEIFDLAFCGSGGRVVAVSDQHFGKGSNVILPGRGKDMGDGWETKRSRIENHHDWIVILLGCIGYLDHVEIDTNHFMGNYPESVEIYAANTQKAPRDVAEEAWVLVLPKTKLGPHRRHFFRLSNVKTQSYTHVRVVIHPDGGIKRVRIYGAQSQNFHRSLKRQETAHYERVEQEGENTCDIPAKRPTIRALPLTQEAFQSFGSVIQAYSNVNAVPRGGSVTLANQGTASKFHHRFTSIRSSFPSDIEPMPVPGFSVYRANPPSAAALGNEFRVTLLERHPCNNQAFFAIGNSSNGRMMDDDLEKSGNAYLVVVAQNGPNDHPDISTMRAFVASSFQGIVYDTGIWHHPIIALGSTMDFVCIETQQGNGNWDCNIVELEQEQTVYIPTLEELMN